MQIDFPLHTDRQGRTAQTSPDDHVHDLIEAVLLTAPGERVNRPDFGSGLLQLVFTGASDELATATQFLVQGSLQQWLGDVIQVDSVEAQSEDGVLGVTVEYVVRRTNRPGTATVSRAV